MNRRTVITTLAAAAALGAQSKEADEITKAEMAFADALKKNDFAALERLLSNDLVYTHSSGLVETKAEYIAKLKSGEQKYSTMDYSNIKARVYGGDAGVLNARIAMTGATKNVPFNNTLLVIHIWIKQGGRWQLVAHQTTRMAA